MTWLRRAQRDTYLISRTLGDAAALQSGGPERLAKRLVRRQIRRSFFRALGPIARWPR
jgi:hypothetical protein